MQNEANTINLVQKTVTEFDDYALSKKLRNFTASQTSAVR